MAAGGSLETVEVDSPPAVSAGSGQEPKTSGGSMTGETELGALIANLRPHLRHGSFVFCSVPGAAYGDHAHLAPIAAVVEPEGLTLVLERERAEQAGFTFEGVFGLISLRVHSSLQAVGLTAAVASRLAELGISANVLAGCLHDHLLVPHDRAPEAVAALERMADGARDRGARGSTGREVPVEG